MFRRFSLIAVLTAFVLVLFAPQVLARVVYSANYDNDTISAIDTGSNQVVGLPISVGDGPYAMAITPNGKTLYVGNSNSEDISVVDIQTNQIVATIPTGYSAASMAVSPDGKTLYFGSDDDAVLVIDTQTNQIVGDPILVGAGLWALALTPDGKKLYVASQEEGVVYVVDTQTRQVSSPIPVGETPIYIAITPDGKSAYVVNEDSDDVSVIDTQTNQVVGSPIPVGESPWGIAITPDGTRAYVANVGSDDVTVIDTQSKQVVGSPIAVGEDPYEAALTPDGKTLYVANYAGDSVSSINTQSNQVTDIPVEGGPWLLAMVPDQSPTASFTTTLGKAGKTSFFSGAPSSDPDGSVAKFDWGFGDGATALNGGPTPTHVYAKAGGFAAGLTVTDNEGCSVNLVYTGRIAYCSGSAAATQTQTITVIAPNNFKFGKLTRNTRKGTAKLRVKVPIAGKLKLVGKKVRTNIRSAKKAGTVVLSIRPKRKLNKALKKTHKAKVRIKVTFSPTGGPARTRGKSVKLIRR
jgi:YVTN family beta-propeller protein